MPKVHKSAVLRKDRVIKKSVDRSANTQYGIQEWLGIPRFILGTEIYFWY